MFLLFVFGFFCKEKTALAVLSGVVKRQHTAHCRPGWEKDDKGYHCINKKLKSGRQTSLWYVPYIRASK